MDKKGRRDGEDGKNTFKSSRGAIGRAGSAEH